MAYVDVSSFFWEFCKAASDASPMEEFMKTPEYDRMNDAVCSGLKLAVVSAPPLRKFGPALVRQLPVGCTWKPDDSLYVFDGINELFYGVRDVLDPHAQCHESLLDRCIKRMNDHVDADELADCLSGVWIAR